MTLREAAMALTLQCPRKHSVPFTEDDLGGEVYCPVCSVACLVPEAEIADEPDVLRCRSRHVVSFTEDDRGGEVYCRTCGVAVEVPAVEEAVPATRRRASVFSSTGEAQVSSNVAGRVPCPRCEQPVEYTVAEFGETVYCTKCGASVTIGQSLQQVVAERAAPAETAATPVAEHRGGRKWLAASFALLLVIVVGFYVATSQFPESMPFDTAGLPWSKAAIAGSGEAVVDPTLAPKELPKPKPQPDKKITEKMVERLLQRDDFAIALDDAERWKDLLVTHQIPKTDPRLKGIEKAIPELKKKIKEAQPVVAKVSPAEKCLDVLDKMLEAIERKNLPEGRRQGKNAEAMLTADADLEKRYRERLNKQQAMLDELARKPLPEKPEKTVADVDKLLEEAMALAEQGKLTEAMEQRARAMFLGPRVELTGADRKRLTGLVKELTTVILKARGLRAVKDAEECAKLNDKTAANTALGEALKDLPEFTSDPAIHAAYKKCTGTPPTDTGLVGRIGRISKPVDTAFGKSVIFRHEYEQMLDHLRDGDKLVLAIDAARKALDAAPDDAAKKKVTAFASEAIEVWILTTGDGERDADRRKDARTALEKTKSWLGEETWKKLSAQLKPE
jgi:hypothetical protein